MRPTLWMRKQTIKNIHRKADIVKRKDIPDKEKFLEERGRLSKISVSDLTTDRRPRYDRAKMRKEFLRELIEGTA